MRANLAMFAAWAALMVTATTAAAQDEASGEREVSDMQRLACSERFGPDDEVGAANLLTPEMAQDAASLVREGKVYSLGLETGTTTPAFGARFFHVTVLQPGQVGGVGLGPTALNYNDDLVSGYTGIGSQLDGLAHIGIDNMYYGCNLNSDFVQADGVDKLGIEKVPNIVTRGVVLDMTAHFGEDPLAEGTVFNEAEITAQAEAQGIEIREGDVVLFHTGWTSLIGEDDERYLAGEPGLGVGGARWLVEQNVVAVGADTWGLEAVPFPDGTGVFEVHQILIPQSGVYILENMNTGPLVEDEAWEFMFVLGHAKATGAVQMIVNPTAIR